MEHENDPGASKGAEVSMPEEAPMLAALKESEARYRRLAENISDVVWVADLDMRVTYVSPSVARMVGEPVENQLKRTVEERFPPDSWEKLVAIFAEELEREKDPDCDKHRSRLVEVQHYRADGSLMWVGMNISFLRDEKGTPIGIRGVTRDITERKQAEESLRMMAEMLDHAPSSITVHDPEGNFLYANRKTFELHGYTPEEFMAINLHHLDVPESAALLAERFRLIEDKGQASFEVCHFRKDGSILPMDVCAKKVVWKDKPAILSIATDITARNQVQKEQQALQTRLSQAVEIARLGYWEYDVARDLFNFDDAFYSIFRTTAEQVGGYTMSPREYAERFLHPEDRILVEEENRKAFETDDPAFSRRFEHRILYADGTVGWISVRYFIVKDEHGRTVKTFGVNQDITERKLADQAVVDSERKWRNVLVNIPLIGISLDPRARIVFANAYFLELTGWREQEVLGQNWFDMFIPEAIREQIRQVFHQVLQNKDTLGLMSYENEILTRSGEWRNIAWSNALTQDARGEVVDVTCLGVDLTERKRAEDALRESEEKYRLLSEKIPDIVWMADLDLRTVYVSPSIEKVLGFTPQERLRQTAAEQLTPDSLARGMDRFARELSLEDQGLGDPGRTVSLELEYYHKNGSTRWMDTIVNTVRNDRGELTAIHGVSRDITERRQAEAEREKLQARFIQAQKMESVGRLAGGVAHDFNNMLGVILGYAELALSQAGEGHPLHDSLQEIHKAARRSAHLTRQLLAFARKQVVSPKVLDLNDTVEGMLQMLRRLIGEDIDLRWLPGARLWPVKIDPSQIDQILANLCVNARDAIDGTGRVTIRTATRILDADDCTAIAESTPDQFVMMEVIDDGVGMEQQTLTNLFEPFFTTKEVGRGTGLGLPTVYGIVKQNGGFIQVLSRPGQGATFRIYLPRHVDETAEREAIQEPDALAPRGHETVLLVEDEPAILSVAQTMLERLGYRVLPAATADEALRLGREHAGRIDLLLTDVIMPALNGRDLAARLREATPELKVLYMSGYTADVIARRGVLEAEAHFIQKPFSKGTLAARVREAIGEG